MIKKLIAVLMRVVMYLFSPKNPSEGEWTTSQQPKEVEYIMLNRKRRRYLASKLRNARVTGNKHAHLYIPKRPDKQAFLEMCMLARVKPSEVLYA